MAQSSERGDADEADESPGRSASVRALWADVRIDPVEIALPGGVGLTLRAYRPATEIAGAERGGDTVVELDDFDAAAAAVAARRAASRPADEDEEVDEDDDLDKRRRGRRPTLRDRGTDEEPADEFEDGYEDELEAEDEEEIDEDTADSGEAEDIPVFLGRRGRLFLFHSPEKLVEFVRSGGEHDLVQLDTWSDLPGRIEAAAVEPLDEDSYELDLVVENLRGGSDAWDPGLILKAGELARDLGFALRLEPVMTALAPGSPLDDLDDALRAADDGGIGGFFAKRKLRKVPAQQSALAWRTIIGKISAAVDWRD